MTRTPNPTNAKSTKTGAPADVGVIYEETDADEDEQDAADAPLPADVASVAGIEWNESPGVTPGLPLGLAETATTVRVVDGTVVATDGPYAEPVGGSLVIEAADIDAAVEVAAGIPAARHGGAIEIRPVETYW